MPKSIIVQLGPIRLDEGAVENFKGGKGDESLIPNLTSWSAYFLNNYLQGGIMLTANDLASIKKSTDTEIGAAEDVLKAVQGAKGRKGGKYTVEVELDPVWYPAATEVAEWQGCTVQDVLNEIVNTVVGNGSLYDWMPPETIPVTAKEIAEIKRLTGEGHVTGRSLIAALKKGVAELVEA